MCSPSTLSSCHRSPDYDDGDDEDDHYRHDCDHTFYTVLLPSITCENDDGDGDDESDVDDDDHHHDYDHTFYSLLLPSITCENYDDDDDRGGWI